MYQRFQSFSAAQKSVIVYTISQNQWYTRFQQY
nr:MAG TPA: hypothetical protein [Caudoviricetes sp.]